MKSVAIIGAGPAGLMAAETLAKAGRNVTVYDHMPSAGRKLLMAGRGGLNLTHSENLENFIVRYGTAADWLGPVIRAFPPEALRAWCHELGQPTFIGSSGRVFPKAMKASPLLRAWLRRLEQLGVRFALRRRWMGWNDAGLLIFRTPEDEIEIVKADATLLALGGASWPRLGSDGGWVEILQRRGVHITPLAPANCGFTVPWTTIFSAKFAGEPLKPVTLAFGGAVVQGEMMMTATGIEGGVVYALSGALRDAIRTHGVTSLSLDLRPGLSVAELRMRLATPRGSQTLSNHVRKFGGLSPVAIGLLFETTPKDILQKAGPQELTRLIKDCRLQLTTVAPIERAISTAGGVARSAVDEHFMLRTLPGVFVAGEMLDWEAPTGGYLLQACFSTAVAAARGILKA